MGLIGSAVAQLTGQKALRTHVAGNKLANEGKVDAANAKYEQALQMYKQAIRQGNTAPNVHMGYAVLLLRLGRFDQGIEVMQGMRSLRTMTEKDWFELRINYAICQWRLGNLDEAIATIGRAAAYAKNSAFYTAQGIFLLEKARKTGGFAEAMAACREALDYDESDPGALDNMGELYTVLMEKARAGGNRGEADTYRKTAIEYYEKAHVARDRQITSIYALAALYHEEGLDDKARDLLDGTGDLYFSAVCPVTREMIDALRMEIERNTPPHA